MKRLVSYTAILLITACAGAEAKKSSKLNTILDGIQNKWNETRTFEADFRQKVESKIMGTEDKSEGTISVLKPDKFRWKSKNDGSIQIINGKKLTYVQPKAQRGRTVVDIYGDFTKHRKVQLLDFLAGNVDLRKLYRAKLLSEKGNTYRLRLQPVKGNGETYIAEVDKKSYLLLALSYETDDTKTRMEFIGPKINRKLDKKLFTYKPGKSDIVNYNK